MKPQLGRGRRPRPLVVLTPGWSGEHVLVRLLAASGVVRSSGYWLALARPQPEVDLRRFLRARTNDAVHCVLVQPGHLWAVNTLDPHDSVERLAADGIAILSLERRSAVDCGVSRSLCGLDGELIPDTQRLVEPAHVMVHVSNAVSAAQWLDEVVPIASPRLVFEDDLADADRRQRTAGELAAFLGLEPWDAPRETDLPTSEVIWSRVANPEDVRTAAAHLPSHEVST